ncbi:MAG: Gmad2 immunoglobulin-like domain-containing protein [Desulfurispora sp.]|uniref:Gmad2 immunoglobulin-like domain-containing protein n=1 Tax=Desulfurispora sp. TaxID=3014275 RepID=UPI004049CA64
MRKYRAVIYLLLILLLIPSCRFWGSGKPEPQPAAPPPPPPSTKKQTAQYLDLAVYYLMDDGKQPYLVREIHRVPYTTAVASAALHELISTPPSTPGAHAVLPPRTRVLGIKIENGLCTVNFSEEVLKANVGAAGEALGIQSIVNTLTEFPEIRQVSFQVNGQVDERIRNWWGHVGLYNQPFQRDLSNVLKPAIWVTYPLPNQVASVPLLVKGSAMVFEGTVSARLKNEQGQEIALGHTTATQGAPGRGDFELRLTYPQPPSGSKGTLEVFWASPKDGSELDKVTIPLIWP